jgi:hypothetical protein
VRKWIDNPTVVAITEKSAPKPKKIKRVTTNLPPPAKRIAQPASRIELRQLLNALGLTPIEVWVRTGETMHKTQAIVLPS